MRVETANIVRRATLAGEISADSAALAHADLADLPVELFPYAPFADRVWELRANVTCYDAWYVALAEYLEAKVATIDVNLSRPAVPPSGFDTPPHPPYATS